MHRPGIEPGAKPWKGFMLPVHHRCSSAVRVGGFEPPTF